MEILVSKAVNPFQAPHKSIGMLDAQAVSKLIAAAADVALVIDQGGIIKDISLGGDALSNAHLTEWLGLPWIETVTIESRHKVEELLRDAILEQPSRWREINHPGPGGKDVPIRYSVLKVTEDGLIIAIGRDLRTIATIQQQLMDAQMSIERDYSRLRQSELRYRLLFQIASEAIIIADAPTARITEINPAALALLGETAKKLISQSLEDLVDPADKMALSAQLAAVRAMGSAQTITVRLTGSGRKASFAASFFRQGNASFILARLMPSEVPVIETTSKTDSGLLKIMKDMPDGFVVTDLDGRILCANTGFLDLAQLAKEDQACGALLSTWLGRSGVDFTLLATNLREHGVVRNFSTIMRGALGSSEEVEISAVAVLGGDQPCFGFVVRPSALRPGVKVNATQLPRSMEQLTELVGRVPLKDLVRESSDLIEKLCIEAALDLTGDNRVSAAEMLGLSRQSLYVKLRRYGLGDLGTEGGEG